MSEAPKRIWAKTNAKPHEIENWYLKEPKEDMTEYVRADIAEEMLKALEYLYTYADLTHGDRIVAREAIAKAESGDT